MPLVRVESIEDTATLRKTGEDNALRGMLGWRRLVSSPLLPLAVAIVLYSVILSDDLFGDEYAQYRWSVLGSSPYGSLLALDINTQLAKVGYVLLREPWAIRLHSVIFSLGTIVLIWIVAKQCFGYRTATLAAWITALSPYLIEFAAEARPNAVFIFSGILFLYALLRFIQNDGWPNTLLLIFSACFGLLGRPMFVAIMLFGFGYYIVQRRTISFKMAVVSLSTVPALILIGYQMQAFSNFAPKESSDAPSSIVNLVSRLPMAFTYGYCTLEYPERDAGWNISIRALLSENKISVVVCVVVFCAFVVGFVQLLRTARSKTVFLATAVIIPILVLIAVQETGFSLLNEKHCAGVAGAYFILLAAIIVQISRYTWGKVSVLLYILLVGISLFHFYFQPEIYSRRSNFTALNSYLTEVLKKDDFLLDYSSLRERNPSYLTILEQTDHVVDLYQDKPTDRSLPEYVSSISTACSGRIYLIYYSIARGWVDPTNCVLPVLKKQRDYVVKRYGRNLLLYEFSEGRVLQFQRP